MTAVVDGAQRSELGEGPVWDAATASLLWIDITPGWLHRLHPESGESSVTRLGATVGAVVPRAGGGILIAFSDRLQVEDADRQTVLSVDTTAHTPRHRFNDGACDSRGRFWTGTTATRFGSEPGALLRLDPDGELRVMRQRVEFSNGIGWSPDEATLYLIDSLDWVLLAFPFDAESGMLGNPRRLVEFDRADGLPDGLAVDALGGIWVARFGGGAIERYDESGRRDERITLPVSQPTSLAFGGPRLSTLWVTSALQDLAAPGEADGALLRLDPGVAGLPSWPFGG